LEAEYAIWPVWPSMPATEEVLTMTPRCPSASAGSVLAMAEAAMRITLKVPTRLTAMTLLVAGQVVRGARRARRSADAPADGPRN